MALVPIISEDDQHLLDEGSFTLSYQFEAMKRSCRENYSHYSSLDFDRLIKPNPFELNWKDVIYFDEISDASLRTFGNKEENRSFDSKYKNPAVSDGVLEKNVLGNNMDSFPIYASQKEGEKEVKERRFDGSKDDMMGENNHKMKLQQKGSQKEKEKEYGGMTTIHEKTMRTFPNGILKMGEKSKYSKSFEESQSHWSRGGSDSFAGSLRSANTLFVFSKFR